MALLLFDKLEALVQPLAVFRLYCYCPFCPAFPLPALWYTIVGFADFMYISRFKSKFITSRLCFQRTTYFPTNRAVDARSASNHWWHWNTNSAPPHLPGHLLVEQIRQ